jgi:SAM-dependent methyltransferase
MPNRPHQQAQSAGSEPWYVTAFGSDYRRVYPHRDLASARAEVAWIQDQGISGRVLDLCCGFGRHSLALAAAGADVFGLDLSGELLQEARTLPGGERLAGRLVRADARLVPFASGAFDALVNLFSSFGYFGDEGDRRVVREIARVLRPGGRALLDLMNPARIRAGLVPESTTERDGVILRESRALVDDGRRVTKTVHLTLPEGEERTWNEDVRMYETEELAALFAPRSLTITAVHGAFGGAPYDAGAERQILVLERKA